jgi:hypothetical protein
MGVKGFCQGIKDSRTFAAYRSLFARVNLRQLHLIARLRAKSVYGAEQCVYG